MDALLHKLPGRRSALIAGALVSGGFHLTLLFGFPAKTPPPVGPVAAQPLLPPDIWVIPSTPPPEPAATKSPDPADATDKPDPEPQRATIPEPDTTLNPGPVVVDFPPVQGVKPDVANPFQGIPVGPGTTNARPDGMTIVDLGDLDKRPEPVARMAPQYPFEAKHQSMQGTVVVRFIVNAAGAVESPMVVSATHAVFSEPALAAVRKWTFKPGLKNGAKVATRMEIPLAFRLDE